MVLNDLWHLKPIPEIAMSFKIDRGLVQNLMGMAAIEASCLLKFSEEMEEFWAYRELFKNLSQRLSNICTVELVPLMQLPCVKMVILEFPFILRVSNKIYYFDFQIIIEGTGKATLFSWLQKNRRYR